MTELARALKLCGIGAGERFSVAAIRDREIRAECFDDVEQAERWLTNWGAGFGLYFCGNPVRPGTTGKPNADDIAEARTLLVDCDPERGANGESDGSAARAAVLRLAAWLSQEVSQFPTVVDSGRGTQAWLNVRLTPEGRRKLAKGLAAKFACDGAKFDATFNVDRLMRLIGSVNPRTGRVASVIHEGTGPAIGPAELERLKLPDAPEIISGATTPADFGAPTEADLALITGEAERVWNSPAEKGERSKRDFRLVLALLKSGATEPAACRLLYAMPGSKAKEDKRGENYWVATLASVRRHMAEEEKKRTLAKSLPEKSRDDPGEPFKSESLDALNFVRDESMPEWQRIRSDFKRIGAIKLGDLETSMAKQARTEVDIEESIRHVHMDGKAIGWWLSVNGNWIGHPFSHVKSYLAGRGLPVDEVIATATDKAWSLVNEPFQDAELPGRRWNKDAARLAFAPSPGTHPTWDMVLRTIGANLDGAVAADSWCKINGVKTGADYLRIWIAALFQFPMEPLPYLFLHGRQGCGKSTFHEVLKPLMTRGCVVADQALVSRDQFNGELAGALLCVVEEVDLSRQRGIAYDRIKKWTTAKTISIHRKGQTPYDLPNTTHFVQCANSPSYCPAALGDTRVVVVHVEAPAAEDTLPKEEILRRCTAEGPAFLHTVMTLTVPVSLGRLRVPVLESAERRDHQRANASRLERWLDMTPDWLTRSEDELTEGFLATLPPREAGEWDVDRVLRELPSGANALRRLVRTLLALGEWRGSSSDLLSKVEPTDWATPDSLGRALAKLDAPLKARGVSLRQVATNVGREWRLTPQYNT